MGSEVNPHRRVIGLAAILLALMTAVVGLGAVRMSGAVEEFEQLTYREYAALDHVLHIDRDLFRAQREIELATAAETRASTQEHIDEYDNQVGRISDRWERYLGVAAATEADVEAHE
ncbi:MAG: hypothetical protein GY724_15005, partial [Actinomycetia bacterium]|nr:hypothetical protein [Actinomycetes bacterium]